MTMMSSRNRPQMTVGEVRKVLARFSADTPVFCGPSIVNHDEPEETQECILADVEQKCVAIESTIYQVTFGWADESEEPGEQSEQSRHESEQNGHKEHKSEQL